MGAIPPGDLVLLRQPVDTQRSVERLYLFPMDTLWTGRVNNATIARADRSVAFDGGSVGANFSYDPDLLTYGSGLEIWFGSSAGAKDVGVRRLRTITSADNGVTGTIVVDWYDDFQLSDDDYITIKNFYPPWPKYSWFTASGPEFRKDGPDGTLYAASGDANDTPDPHVMMGRNYAGELPASGNLTIQCDASNTQDVAGGGGGSTYAWAITPDTAAVSFDNAALAAPTLTVTQAGTGAYQLHCTVTIDGRSTTAHRAVIVGGGITEFTRSAISHQYDSTDIQVTLTLTSPDETDTDAIRPVVDWDDVQDHSLAIITATDYYGTTQKSITFRDDNVYTDREHIVFCGYLILENDDLEPDGSGRVELSAVSLVDMFLYSQSLTGVQDATQWYEMADDLMTVAGNLLYLFRWHSTLLDIADWWLPWSDVVRRSANEEFSEGDMVERARELARARLMGITGNPQGEVFVETDLNLRTVTQRGAEDTTLTLTEPDVAAVKRVRTRRRGDVVRVLADGGYSSGVIGSFQPFFAASQNVALAEARPALAHIDRLMLPSQTESNRVAARLQAVANRRFIEVNLEFTGNYREIFSPADQQWTNLGNTFASTLMANIRAYTDLESALCVPRQVTHNHDNGTGQTLVSAIFDVEAPVELEGRTITPPSVPSEDPGDGGWDFPSPPEWPLPDQFTLTGTLLAFDAAEGLWVRFNGASDWVERNGSRGADDNDVQGGWDPWWWTASKQNSTNPNDAILWACQAGKIWRSTDCGQTWTDMSPFIPDPPNAWGDATAPTVADLTFFQRTDNIHRNKEHYFLAGWQEPIAGDWRGWILKTDDDGALGSWEWLTLAGTSINTCATCSPLPCFGIDGASCPAGCGSGDLSPDGTWRTLTSTQAIDLCPDDALPAHRIYFHLDATRSVSTRNAAGMAACGVNLLRGSDCGGPVISTDVTTQNDMQINTLNLTSTDPFTIEVNIGDTIASDEVQPIWMDCDSEDGSTLYVTLWDGTDLRLYVYTTDLEYDSNVDLGAASEAQVLAKTYIAYPFTPTFNKDVCYVFGRMDAPGGLGAGVQHVIYTDDGGSNWASVENGFGNDHVGALRAEGTTDAARTLYAIRNDASGAVVPKLYSDTESLTFVSNLSMPAGEWVQVDAMTINLDAGQIACGSDTGGGNVIIISNSPYAAWSDITDSYPGSTVQSLTYV